MTTGWSSDQPEFDPLVVESTDSDPRDGRGDPPWWTGRARAVLVAVSVGVAVVAVVGAILSIIDSSSEQTIEEPPTTSPVTTPVESLAPVVTSYPFGSTVIDVSDSTPEIPRDFGLDGWIDWSIEPSEVAEAFGTAAPTEVVAITADGVLHRIELPGGRVRSRPVPDVSTRPQIALAAEAVAVPQFDDVAVVAEDGSLSSFGESTRQVPRVVALGESDRFLVVGGRPAPAAPEELWLLDPDGSVVDVDSGAFAEADPWNRQFLPSGELLVTGDGGVDAAGVDGTVLRIDDGEIVATGGNHYAIRQCGDPCEYTVVELSTGRRTPAELAMLDDYRFWDTAARLSPDGRYLYLADWRRQRPVAQLVSIATGGVANSWPLDTIRTPDAWASDSLGYFDLAGGSLALYSVDGRVTVIEGLGPIRSVATRPLG